MPERDEAPARGLHPLAGKPAPASMLANIPRLVSAYFSERPDPTVREEQVAFGTSGHRGSALRRSFNEAHILAIAHALVGFRRSEGIDGPHSSASTPMRCPSPRSSAYSKCSRRAASR